MMGELTKRDSACVKGIAIILMLFHHLFNDYPEYEGYPVNYAPFTGDRLTQLALLAKVCVALFVFVSGYGLTKSFLNGKEREGLRTFEEYLKFSLSRWWKLMCSYWFVFALMLVCQPLGRTVFDAYGSDMSSLWRYLVIDALGLYFVRSTPPLNPTTWYLTLAIWFLFVVPLVNVAIDRWGLWKGLLPWAFVAVVFGWGDTYCHYLIVALVGVAVARSSMMRWIDSRIQSDVMRVGASLMALACAVSLMVLQLRGHQCFGLTEGFTALCMALACHMLLTKGALSRSLMFLGEHSTYMFLTHTMLYSYYFLGFFYERYYWWLITATLVIVSLLVSLALEWLARASGYERLMKSVGTRLFA